MIRARLVSLAAFAALVTTPLAAQEADPLGQFRDWGAYAAETENGKVCYVLSQPKQTEPDNVNRDPVYFFITRRPDQGVENEVSVITGYPYRDGSQAAIEVDDEDSFALFTRNDGGWIENSAEEARLIRAMRAGTDMVVTGTSQRGTETTDTYSLLGVSAALDRIRQECS